MTEQTAATSTLVTAFRRLFENEFATLDGITISLRTRQDVRFVDERSALGCMLFGNEAGTMTEPPRSETHALHLALYQASPQAESVVSGWSRHLRALLLEGYEPPEPTSMMRKRGIPDVGAHLVAPDALAGEALARSIEQAQSLASENGMRHLLLVTTEGMVAVAGAPANEAMAHWHNIEFASRVACLSIEEASVHQASRDGSDA